MVAPRAGAWIETPEKVPEDVVDLTSHPVRVRGLKLLSFYLPPFSVRSHPVRVRGLKPVVAVEVTAVVASHPVRVRGLKPVINDVSRKGSSRTPCGCVD